MRKSEGLCWGRKVPPERPMYWNGRSESNSWMREPWGDPRRIAGRAVWSRCGRFRVRAYLLRPERW